MATSPRKLQILIVGGGPGGLSAASYLREHHDVTVLEKSDGSTTDDYGISVVANAYGLLQKHGLRDDRIDHCILTHMRVRDKDNIPIADIPFDTRKTVGAPSVLLKRSEIAAEIRRLATDPDRPGTPARIIDNVKVSKVDINKASVTTDDGNTFTGDILIGADGINSSIRSAVLEAASSGEQTVSEEPKGRPRPSGLVAYVTSVPREVIASNEDLAFQADVDTAAAITAYYGAAGRDSKERILVYPINQTHFQVVGYSPETTWVAEFEASKSSILKNQASSRAVEDFKYFHPSVCKLFSVNSTCDVWRIRDVVPITSWGSGRTLLIGDAAHACTPHTGHGANMAIEDGEALGYIFSDIGTLPIESPKQLDGAIQECFQKFMSVRVLRSHYVQKAARLASGIAPPEEGRFDPRAFSQAMHGYTGAEAALKSPSSQPSYDI